MASNPKYTVAEGLLVKQMLKDLATLKMNHPQALGSWVDDASDDLKYILEFISDLLVRQEND